MKAKTLSLLSQLFHYFRYILEDPKMQLINGMVILSIDVDVGNKMVGVQNKGKNDANVNRYISEYSVGEMEERALPLIIDFLNEFEIPATFAIRGQLIEVDTSILETLLKSPVKHDIGSHGYYHREFTKLSRKQAENELDMVSMAMKRVGITPRSFVFPNNSVTHLDLLQKFGYKCYRDYGDFMNDGMYAEKHGQLYDIHPSLFIGQGVNSVIIKKIIDISTKSKLPFHMWFHPWDLGKRRESIQRRINKVLFPLFKYAKEKEKDGLLTFETMLSAVNKFENY